MTINEHDLRDMREEEEAQLDLELERWSDCLPREEARQKDHDDAVAARRREMLGGFSNGELVRELERRGLLVIVQAEQSVNRLELATAGDEIAAAAIMLASRMAARAATEDPDLLLVSRRNLTTSAHTLFRASLILLKTGVLDDVGL